MNTFTPQEVEQLLVAANPGATVYLVGAGGCGMSGLGHLLLDLGFRVAGSDLSRNQEVIELEARGALIQKGHKAENLAAATPILVVYSSAVRLHNPELNLAQELQIPVVRRAILLSALLRRGQGICVAGMHGKTTTTALLTFALAHLQANPSYAIGALVPQLRRHAFFAAGAGSPSRGASPAAVTAPFVIEVDESDGTLREFEPEYAIVLNIDEEHLDYYASLEAICSAFRQFTQQTRRTVVYCADDAALSDLLAGHPSAISYGFGSKAQYRIVPGTSVPVRAPEFKILNPFSVWKDGLKLGDFTLSLLGEQNISNAGAVVALLHHLGYAPADIARAMAPFCGAARRQQLLFRGPQVCVFDDYGHHPAEIAATLRAFKRLAPGRLLVAFQPHRFTRTRFLLKQFSTAFSDADRLWVTEIYAASEAEIAGINGAILAKAIRDQGQPVEFIASLDELRRDLRAALQPGDLLLFLGAGDITRAAHLLAGELQREHVVAPKRSCLSA